MEHSLSMARVAEAMAAHYEGVDRSLLLTGVLLHDIGKVDELVMNLGIVDYTDRGRLKGHLVIGSEMVAAAAARIPDFPQDLLEQVQHLILSHHGRQEFGSPTVPMTVEALLLSFIDDLDAKMNVLEQSAAKDEWQSDAMDGVSAGPGAISLSQRPGRKRWPGGLCRCSCRSNSSLFFRVEWTGLWDDSGRGICFTGMFGQEKAKKLILRTLAAGRLPHAFLFKGPEGVGKQLFARGMAAALNCRDQAHPGACGQCVSCRKFRSGNHPDFYGDQPGKRRDQD